MTIIENLKTIRTRLTKATTSISDDVATLRDQIREKRADLKRLASAPAPRADIEERVRELVERTAKSWIDREGAIAISRLGSPSQGAAVPWFARADAMPWEVQCVADPDSAAALMLAIVGRIEYEPGPPLADRPAMIAKIEAELRELEVGEEQLVDEACKAGVTITHRPEVVTRRQNEARAAELEAQRVADRAARQAALDEAHRSRPSRVGRSEYLARQ